MKAKYVWYLTTDRSTSLEMHDVRTGNKTNLSSLFAGTMTE